MNKKQLIESLIIVENDYERAYKLVKILFKNITDKEKQPYIKHLERVSDKLTNQDTKIAGLLHDVVEDTDFTLNDLRKLNFNENIIRLVEIVTNNNLTKESYHDKITSIIESDNIEAIKLKYSDMSDNANPKRLSKLPEEKRNYFINKYQPELIRLENILKERREKL